MYLFHGDDDLPNDTDQCSGENNILYKGEHNYYVLLYYYNIGIYWYIVQITGTYTRVEVPGIRDTRDMYVSDYTRSTRCLLVMLSMHY